MMLISLGVTFVIRTSRKVLPLVVFSSVIFSSVAWEVATSPTARKDSIKSQEFRRYEPFMPTAYAAAFCLSIKKQRSLTR